MSDFFSPKRFFSYTWKVYTENSRKYLSYILLLICLQGSVILLTALVRDYNPTSVPVLIFGLLGLVPAVLFVFSEMKPFRDRHTYALSNTVPVSVFERYLLIIINTTIVFSIVYVAVYYFVTLISSAIFGCGNVAVYFGGQSGLWGDKRLGIVALKGILIFLPFAIFAGATGIRNHLLAFVVVLIVAVPLLGSPTYLPWFIESNLLNGVELNAYFNGLSVSAESTGTVMEYSTVPMFGELYTRLVGKGYEFYIWTLLLITAGYFKLKERQVK